MADVPKLPEVWGVYFEDTLLEVHSDRVDADACMDFFTGSNIVNLTSAAKAEAVREFAATHGWELPVGAVDEFCARKGFKTLDEQREGGA